MVSMISGLAKELTAYRNLLETKGFEKLVLIPTKSMIIKPFQDFIDAKVADILKNVPLTKIEGGMIGQMSTNLLELNTTMKLHSSSLNRLADSMKIFASALRLFSLLFFGGSLMWFSYMIVWSWWRWKQNHRSRSTTYQDPSLDIE